MDGSAPPDFGMNSHHGSLGSTNHISTIPPGPMPPVQARLPASVLAAAGSSQGLAFGPPLAPPLNFSYGNEEIARLHNGVQPLRRISGPLPGPSLVQRHSTPADLHAQGQHARQGSQGNMQHQQQPRPGSASSSQLPNRTPQTPHYLPQQSQAPAHPKGPPGNPDAVSEILSRLIHPLQVQVESSWAQSVQHMRAFVEKLYRDFSTALRNEKARTTQFQTENAQLRARVTNLEGELTDLRVHHWNAVESARKAQSKASEMEAKASAADAKVATLEQINQNNQNAGMEQQVWATFYPAIKKEVEEKLNIAFATVEQERRMRLAAEKDYYKLLQATLKTAPTIPDAPVSQQLGSRSTSPSHTQDHLAPRESMPAQAQSQLPSRQTSLHPPSRQPSLNPISTTGLQDKTTTRPSPGPTPQSNDSSPDAMAIVLTDSPSLNLAGLPSPVLPDSPESEDSKPPRTIPHPSAIPHLGADPPPNPLKRHRSESASDNGREGTQENGSGNLSRGDGNAGDSGRPHIRPRLLERAGGRKTMLEWWQSNPQPQKSAPPRVSRAASGVSTQEPPGTGPKPGSTASHQPPEPNRPGPLAFSAGPSELNSSSGLFTPTTTPAVDPQRSDDNGTPTSSMGPPPPPGAIRRTSGGSAHAGHAHASVPPIETAAPEREEGEEDETAIKPDPEDEIDQLAGDDGRASAAPTLGPRLGSREEGEVEEGEIDNRPGNLSGSASSVQAPRPTAPIGSGSAQARKAVPYPFKAPALRSASLNGPTPPTSSASSLGPPSTPLSHPTNASSTATAAVSASPSTSVGPSAAQHCPNNPSNVSLPSKPIPASIPSSTPSAGASHQPQAMAGPVASSSQNRPQHLPVPPHVPPAVPAQPPSTNPNVNNHHNRGFKWRPSSWPAQPPSQPTAPRLSTSQTPADANLPQKPTKAPTLGLAHLPLLYGETNGKMVCRACMIRKHQPENAGKVMRVVAFETTASFPDMIKHYDEHPVAREEILSLTRAQIAEMQQRIKK